MLKKFFLALFLSLFLFNFLAFQVQAQTRVTVTPRVTGIPSVTGEPTGEAEEPTPVPKKPDLTEPVEEVVGPLEKLLREQEVGNLGVNNFLKHFIRRIIYFGVPPNTIVLLLLLPLIAALIAAARHFLGIAGFGIFTPAMISVAFLATGITPGLFIFLVTLLMATLSRMALKKIKVHYLPRMAILLWAICLGLFFVIFNFPKVSIFPILFMVLLVENFIEVQIGRSGREAIALTVETLLIALACYFLLNWSFLQAFVLLNPEASVIGVLAFNLLVGRYTGFRFLEYHRFRSAFKR